MSSSTPTVSVLVTVYDREKYLADCLDSILASTWRDFEVVIVDDCSSDNSVAIARSYAENDPRIRFYQNSENLGDYPNRNRAASLARGEYLKYLDADDVIYPHGLDVMVRALDKFPEAGFALSCRDRNPPAPFPFCTDPETAIRGFFFGNSVFGPGPSASLIRRSAFEAVGGFSGRQFVGDAELWLKLAEQWPVVSLPPALVWWRRHEGQEFAKGWLNGEYLANGFKVAREALSSPACPLSDTNRRQALAKAKQHHARRLLALATKGGKPREAWRMFRSSGLGVGELAKGLRSYEL